MPPIREAHREEQETPFLVVGAMPFEFPALKRTFRHGRVRKGKGGEEEGGQARKEKKTCFFFLKKKLWHSLNVCVTERNHL